MHDSVLPPCPYLFFQQYKNNQNARSALFVPSDARLHFAGCFRFRFQSFPRRRLSPGAVAGWRRGWRGSVGGEERELGGRAPAGAEVARCSPAPPHELIPGSAPRDDIMVSPPAHSGRAPAVPEQGKISIGISSCSRGTGILCKGVVACILSAPA